ncbi:glycosyltransferase family 4 protein [Salinimicrobium sediminilitoris]|uniref:glycosyltransferase family 4 protein n=1 Tax=Salinimicrobium sediminilitoris TaxID=2876715 RepID=UPI001E557E60|nr:glycosyltransferase family 4 protein [Salinimicrobium sediminilitoris]MCC8361454.1 glycosyltransferase family 4 protein [Salinimicrobium sediminilitoris]
MRILHLSAVRNWGGGEKHIENLCLEMAKNHPEVFNIILCRKGSLFEQSLIKQNLKHYTSPVFTNFDFRYALKIISVCKKENIDLIHIHDPKALALAVAIDKFKDLPPFIFSKKTSFPIRSRRQTLYKYNYPKIKKILCVSEATREISLAALDHHERLEVIYHGTSLKNKDTKPPFLIANKYNLPDDAVIIGNIANHIEAKNLETLVQTANYLVNQKKQKNLYFFQVGNFSQETKTLKNLVRELGLENHIFFTGYIPEASAFIPQFDMMLLTSESEGIPQVIYESFYYNVPVVSTNVGGIPEVIENNVNGLLNDPYDHKGLGENLLFLIENPQVIPNFAKISREKLFKHFTSRIMAGKTLEAYKNTLNGRLH